MVCGDLKNPFFERFCGVVPVSIFGDEKKDLLGGVFGVGISQEPAEKGADTREELLGELIEGRRSRFDFHSTGTTDEMGGR